MVVYGEADRPRVIAQGFDESHPFAEVVKRYSGTVHFLNDTSKIRWESWDASVTLATPQNYHDHMRVIQVGGNPIGARMTSPTTTTHALWLTKNAGDELVVPDALPDELKDLVKKELLPLVMATDHDPAFQCRISPTGFQSDAGGAEKYAPLIHDLDGYALAALYRPPVGVYEVLYLPPLVKNLTPWLLFALKHWAKDAPPGVFPSEPEWTLNPTWMTSTELSAQSGLADTCATAERVINQAQTEVEKAEAELVSAREAADASVRLLLTGSDEPLVDVVYEPSICSAFR